MRITRVLVVLAAVAAIVAPVAIAFGFTDGHNPPDGAVGTSYNWQFVADGGCKPYSFSIKSGALPTGLSLDSGGTISGTPSQAGSFSFWAEVRDSAVTCPPNGSEPSQRFFTITIVAKLTVTTPGQLPVATVGTPYSVKFTADGGGSQTWSLAGGTLPAGLGLAADGTLSGTPTADTPSPVTFTVKVTDGTRSDTKDLQLDVVKPLAITPPTLPAAEAGQTLKPTTFTATGGRQAYVWSLVNAPSWLAIDPASGVLTGSPDAAGVSAFQVAVKDMYGTTATSDVALAVKAKVTVKTAKLPATKVGRSYRWLLRAAGGVAPFTWRVTAGKFPVGIRLNRKTGVLSGIPRKAGLYPLTFMVRDSLGVTSEVGLRLNVLPLKKKKK